MMLTMLAALVIVQPNNSQETVVFRTTKDGVIAPDRTAALFVISKCVKRQVYYRVELLDDETYEISVRGGFAHYPYPDSPVLGGELRDNSIHIPEQDVRKAEFRTKPVAKRTKEGMSVNANQIDVHWVLFDVMTLARRSYQVGPGVLGIVTMYQSSEQIEYLAYIALAQVDALVLIDKTDLIAINKQGLVRGGALVYRGYSPYTSQK